MGREVKRKKNEGIISFFIIYNFERTTKTTTTSHFHDPVKI
jgi:hypothetical protein